jgi:hypothetical protein
MKASSLKSQRSRLVAFETVNYVYNRRIWETKDGMGEMCKSDV